jgi:guanyl-specific ribonuclease Sa
MKGSTVALIGLGVLGVLGAGGAAVYFATRKAPAQQGPSDQALLADARARELEALAAQAQADAARAQAEAARQAAKAADRPLAEEITLTLIEKGGDFLAGWASGGFKL